MKKRALNIMLAIVNLIVIVGLIWAIIFFIPQPIAQGVAGIIALRLLYQEILLVREL